MMHKCNNWMVMLFVKVLVRYIDHQRDMGVVLGERDIRREIMRHRGRWVWGEPVLPRGTGEWRKGQH